MWFEPTPVAETSFRYGAGIFQVLWQFLKIAASPACGASRTIQAGESLAILGGKKCSNYLNNRAPKQKSAPALIFVLVLGAGV
jgi:hypothetical protein